MQIANIPCPTGETHNLPQIHIPNTILSISEWYYWSSHCIICLLKTVSSHPHQRLSAFQVQTLTKPLAT